MTRQRAQLTIQIEKQRMHVRAIVAVFLTLSVAAPLCALARNDSTSKHPARNVRNEFEQLEHQWRDALLKGDTKAMAGLLDDGYVSISANGVIEDKEQTLAARTAGSITFRRLDFTDMKVRMYSGGSTAVVTSTADVEGANGGQDISGKYRFTRVYAKKLGQWRIVTFQASRIGQARGQ